MSAPWPLLSEQKNYLNLFSFYIASRYGSSMNAPDMEDVKESVKQGVSKVAGRLSNMASGVMTQIQVVKITSNTKLYYYKD